jgi:hypothetical protein
MFDLDDHLLPLGFGEALAGLVQGLVDGPCDNAGGHLDL